MSTALRMRELVKSGHWSPIPHFDDRIVKTGRMTYPEVFEIIANGTISNAKPVHNQFRMKFVLGKKAVICATSMIGRSDPDHIFNGGRVLLITCFNIDDWGLEENQSIQYPLKEVVVREKVVERVVARPIEDMTEEELEDELRRRRETREAERMDALRRSREAISLEVQDLEARLSDAKARLRAVAQELGGGGGSETPESSSGKLSALTREEFVSSTIAGLAEKYGVSRPAIYNRARRAGWSKEEM